MPPTIRQLLQNWPVWFIGIVNPLTRTILKILHGVQRGGFVNHVFILIGYLGQLIRGGAGIRFNTFGGEVTHPTPIRSMPLMQWPPYH